jgi:hypothetical protein
MFKLNITCAVDSFRLCSYEVDFPLHSGFELRHIVAIAFFRALVTVKGIIVDF